MTRKGIAIRVMMILLMAVTMAGCSSSRKGVKAPSSTGNTAWNTLRVPVNLRMEAPNRFSTGSITMYLERDRSVTYSMTFLGMEVGALHITADSLLAYSMPQRIYVAEDLSSALGGVSLPMADLQALLLGESFPADMDKFSTYGNGGNSFNVDSRCDAVSGRLESLTVVQTSTDRSVTLSWKQNASLMELPFAESLSLNLSGAKGTTLAATITYSWNRAKIDDGNTRRFHLPTNYKRVAGRDLLKALTSM